MEDKFQRNKERMDSLSEARNKQLALKELEMLRDQFAMAALAGLLADGLSDAELMAAIAYRIADAMLEARKK